MLCRRLSEALHGVGYLENRPLSVLNLACGRADETGAIAQALAPARIGFYLGMDLRAEAITEANQRWKLPLGVIDFRCGDASRIGAIERIGEVDLVFIRHQNYWNDPRAWDWIVEGALKVLKPGGLLVCTSYFDHEHELFVAAVKTRSAEVLWNARNPDSRVLEPESGKSVDRHLVLFRKGQ